MAYNNYSKQQQEMQVLQSQMQQLQISKIKEEYEFQNAQKIEQQNQQKQQQLIDLKNNNFDYNSAYNSQDNKLNNEKDEYIVKLTNSIYVKLVLHYDFPESKPRIYLINKLNHKFIDEKTWEIIYSSFFQWESSKSKLSQIFSMIKCIFENEPPKEDELINQINSTKNQVCEEHLYQNLMQIDLGKIFKGKSPDDWKVMDMQNIQKFDEQLLQTEEHKKLVEFVLSLMNLNQELNQKTQQKIEETQNIKEKVLQVAELCDIKKRKLIQLNLNSQQIKDRFSKSNVLNYLDQLIQESQEQEDKFNENFDIEGYKELKLKQNKLKIQQQLLEKQI